MPPSSAPLLVACAFATAACGATQRAAAEPRKPPPDDRPLVAGPVETDADLARAIREQYTKHEWRIPMRDGVRLWTEAYVPKDDTRTWPILLLRTPYGVPPYGIENYPSTRDTRALRRFAPSPAVVRDGYVLVRQDVRGRMMSEGTFVDVRPHAQNKGEVDESTDCWDTIDWLVKNVPRTSGRAGAWGISYPGFYAAQCAVDAHPALRAVSPQAPVTEWFLGDDFHHNGVFFLADAFDFYASFGKARPKPVKKWTWGFDHDVADVYDFFLAMGPVANADAKYLRGEIPFWKDLVAHPTRDDFWKARDPRPWYRDARPAVLTVGGWFDAEDLFGALETYRAFERQSPRKAQNTLVMGPWSHGGWSRGDGADLGDIGFGQKTSAFFRDHVELPFFQRHLKGKDVPAPPEALVFETGTNEWRRLDAWPPPGSRMQSLHMRARGRLSGGPPNANEDEAGADSYGSDPAKPVPYRGRPGGSIDGAYMTDDQRFAARRPDVVVWSTGELDADVVVCGPIEADLWVSTSGTDADFVVKLVDVWPQDTADPDPNPAGVKMGGYQQLVRAEIFRGKFRDSFERPEPFRPGEPAHVRFALPDACHAFRPGHRIMVQIQSSWFPLADRNPQTFVDVYKATEADFRAATHRVFRTPERPSAVRVTVVRGTIPVP